MHLSISRCATMRRKDIKKEHTTQFMLRSWAPEILKQLYVCTYTMQPSWHSAT